MWEGREREKNRREGEGTKEGAEFRHERKAIDPRESGNWDEGERLKGESGSNSLGEHKRDCRIVGWERFSLSLIWQAFEGDSGSLVRLHSDAPTFNSSVIGLC